MRLFPLLLLIACGHEDFGTDVSGGLLGNGRGDPFPNATLVGEQGLDLTDAVPLSATPIPVDRVAWRTGFSPVQTSVIRLPDVNPDALPSWREPTPGEGGVLLLDLDTGEFLPVMAELDAYPDDNPEPVLLVRPQIAVPYGHTVAVVVTTDAAPRPERFDRIVDGDPPENFGGGVAHWRELMDTLEANGIARDDVAVAWDYPVGDGTKPLRSALEQIDTGGDWTFTRIREKDAGDTVGYGAWRVAEGRFEVTDFLVDDVWLDLGADGSVAPTGTDEATLYVHVPESVKDAPAGSVPVLVFGHGIFARPADHLDTSWSSSPLWLAEELGMIIVATRWRGLDYDDVPGALSVANDFGNLPTIGDRMVQGQANTRTLVEMVASGALLADPVFQGASGQSLADPEAIYFQGMSMGSIEGAVLVANDAPIRASVLHIGGSTWSTMLERSSNWGVFEDLVKRVMEDPRERQRVYSLLQLYVDPVDPAAYAEDLRDKSVLLQENLGDESVSNIGTRLLARSIGLPLLEPAHEGVLGVSGAAAPLPPGARAYVQLDPGKGEPPDENRPAPSSGAHAGTEAWPGTRAQMRDFLTPGTEGSVVHHCGEEACSSSNRGSYD